MIKRFTEFLYHLTRYLELKTAKLQEYNDRVAREISEQKRLKPYSRPMIPYKIITDWEKTR